MDNHDLDEVPRKAFRRRAGLSWDLKHGRGGGENMPVTGPRGWSPPSEHTGCLRGIGRKHKGGWVDEAEEGGTGRIRAEDPVLKILLRSEANEKMKIFVQGDAVYTYCLFIWELCSFKASYWRVKLRGSWLESSWIPFTYTGPFEVEVIISTFWKEKKSLWNFSVYCLNT